MDVKIDELPRQIQDMIRERNRKQELVDMITNEEIKPLEIERYVISKAIENIELCDKGVIKYIYNVGDIVKIHFDSKEELLKLLRARLEDLKNKVIPLKKQWQIHVDDIRTLDNKINAKILEWQKKQQRRER